ncbi:NAD(P)/FAD-dependent oxidoreductase [Nocardioides euryhalodurans]|uniref:NAD(P)/FAD-dependent oxidoreductase n=1 Tax=Nocardioides euryhalodurans TaxID=2518370 RepID=A0A4P7GNI5_9ACTN|nr:FAD/NAD(P)-binding oxidoreductase [Nocardioides euryhalodurans]QBR93778.1 NAD(P)/FAD-dependent oxidoreductase [Nocardioides euryhalodurans]
MAAAPLRVVILGAGFGGLEVATRLSAALGSEVDVRLVDRSDGFVFGFSKLDVMFGRTTADHVHLAYADLAHPGVTLVRDEVVAIDPVGHVVTLGSGTLEADVLVVALGADLDPAATPGLTDGGHEFYSVAGAIEAGQALQRFEGGRVVVAVTSTPFKCPPAPSETALMVHDFLTGRGLRERSEIELVMPLPRPIPPSPQASEAVLEAFAERGIGFRPGAMVRSVEDRGRRLVCSDGDTLDCDLLLAVPKHRAPAVVVASGLAEDGWVPVDPQTLRTRFAGVYAVGDVTSVGTPKAGVFAEGQAAVVAEQIIRERALTTSSAGYDGRGICYMELGGGRIGKVDVTFTPGEAPHGTLEGPSLALAADKRAFGTDRALRWFGRDWTPVGE